MTMRSRKHPVWFCLLTLCAFVCNARSASACSCGPTPTVLDSFEESEIVIVAQVISIEKASEKENPDGVRYVAGVRSATLRVEKVFKGEVKVRDELVFGQGGGADCIWTFDEESVGHELLLYIHAPSAGTKLWYIGGCGRSTNVKGATEDLGYLENMEKLRGKTRISGTLGGWQNPDLDVKARKVRIIGPNKTYELKTDDDGFFEIYDLPPGNYMIEPQIPAGWKIDPHWFRYSPSVPYDEERKPGTQVPIILEAKKHASVNIVFQVDNAVRGKVFGPNGKPLYGVCLYLLLKEGEGSGGFGCTDEQGKFEITSVARGEYVLAANQDGKLSSRQPFPTIYYPNVAERERAAVLSIAPGETVKGINIVVPRLAETITVEGVLRYSDGKPVDDERVSFKGAKTDGIDGDAAAKTDAEGRFSIKILKGVKGELSAEDYVYVGQFENCPKLESLIRKTGRSTATIKTNIVEIHAEQNFYDVELKFPFPGCKKAKKDF